MIECPDTFFVVAVAQPAELRTVDAAVGGSNPLSHPSVDRRREILKDTQMRAFFYLCDLHQTSILSFSISKRGRGIRVDHALSRGNPSVT